MSRGQTMVKNPAAYESLLSPIRLARRLNPYWPILAYHSISDARRDGLATPTAEFENQLRWLRESGFESATLEDVLAQAEGTPPEPAPGQAGRKVAITFDDGYRDNHSLALPLLRKYGYTATFFVVTDLVGTDQLNFFDKEKPGAGLGPESAFAVMDWDEVGDLAGKGMHIGSHTCSHRPFEPAVADVDLEREIVASRDVLESRLNLKADLFCYPRGKLDPRAYRILERAGYRAAVVTPALRDGIVETRFTLKRIGLYRGSPLRFRIKISPSFFRLRSVGAFRWV